MKNFKHNIPIFLFLLPILVNVGCNNPAPKTHSTWCVLLDMSGVRESMEMKSAYSQTVGKFMAEVEPGDKLVVAMITESSVNEMSYVANINFPVFQASTDNQLIRDAEEKKFDDRFSETVNSEVRKIQQFILESDRIASTTDIIGAIHVAKSIFEQEPNNNKVLLLLSDMIQNSSDYQFYKAELNPQKIEDILEKESKSIRGIPDLNGVNVYVVGANSRNTDQFFKVKSFWMKYFYACHAHIDKADYGAAFNGMSK